MSEGNNTKRVGEADFVELLAAVREAVAEATQPRLLIPQKDVPGFLGISRSAFFRVKSQAGFPRPVSIPGEVAYRAADLAAWAARLPAKRAQRRRDEPTA